MEYSRQFETPYTKEQLSVLEKYKTYQNLSLRYKLSSKFSPEQMQELCYAKENDCYLSVLDNVKLGPEIMHIVWVTYQERVDLTPYVNAGNTVETLSIVAKSLISGTDPRNLDPMLSPEELRNCAVIVEPALCRTYVFSCDLGGTIGGFAYSCTNNIEDARKLVRTNRDVFDVRSLDKVIFPHQGNSGVIWNGEL